MGNFFKNLGIVILIGMGFLIYGLTGPHSPEEVLKEMKKAKEKAESFERGGDSFMSKAVTDVVSDVMKGTEQSKADCKNAFYSYLDAKDEWRSYYDNADKFDRWETLKNYESQAKLLAENKMQELERKIQYSGGSRCP
jgi:hypothetical protein